jgi:CBS-domain-containing membrane protein
MTIADYLGKMKGGAKIPPGVRLIEVLWSSLGAAVGIGLCAFLSSYFFEPRDLSLLIASLGASAVLVFAAIKSPFSQPRNLIGGHVIGGLVGVVCFQFLGDTVWLAGAMAVSCSIALMLLTKTLHPPAGATALIAIIGGPKIHSLGFLFPLIPAGAGAVVILLVALIVNNMSSDKKYPEYWL